MAQGAGGEKGSAVQAGLSAQPLVTSAADVINPSATEQLTDAFRKGFITADDVIQRIGPVGQAQTKANVLALNEFASPEQIAARRAQAEAALSGSQLQTAQNQASEPLVSPLAQKAKADIWQKNALDTYQEHYGVPLYVKDNQGNDTDQPDIKTMASKGAEIIQAKQAIGYANSMLQGSWQVRKDKDGTAHEVLLNKMGQDVTPVKGNPWYDHFSDLQMQGEQVVFQPRSVNPNDVNWHPTPPKPGEAASAPNTAQPSADLIQPYVPGTGIPSGPKPGTTDPEQIELQGKLRQQLKEEDAKKVYDQGQTFFNRIKKIGEDLKSLPLEQQRIGSAALNTQDSALADAVVKLFDPSGVVREFKWNKVVEDSPRLEGIRSLLQTVQSTGKMSAITRQQLIQEGYNQIIAREEALRPHLKRVDDTAKAVGMRVPVLTDEENAILHHQGVEAYKLPPEFKSVFGNFITSTPGSSAAPTSTGVVPIPGVGNVYKDAQGNYRVRQ
jgi:hypothetical protein